MDGLPKMICTMPASDKYRENWERIWGQKASAPAPVMRCPARGRGENGSHEPDCAWLNGQIALKEHGHVFTTQGAE